MNESQQNSSSLFGHIADARRAVSGNLDVAAQKFQILGRDILETHANSESWRSARNLAVQLQLGFSQPQCDFEFGVHPQRNGHFYEAAAQAQIRNLTTISLAAPPGGLPQRWSTSLGRIGAGPCLQSESCPSPRTAKESPRTVFPGSD
jgi:hypothetical protein